ncbi:MAG: 4Fe-4S dicluster domain-containing protein [Deltaproteobacteria bacterium]|nr:4Fe-4S dicluster domain-containing protein [Deltaproteobacteria bacterium]
MTLPRLVYEKQKTPSFAEEVMERSGQNIMACYQCKKCAAGCPVGKEISMTPDRLIRMIIFGDREGALFNPLVWRCVSCYTCGTRCANGIQVGRITETLKQMARESKYEPLVPRVKEFHNAFCASAKHMGRVNEMEFMGLYEMKNILHEIKNHNLKGIVDELLEQAKTGIAMGRKKRMHFGVERVRDRSEIKRLFKISEEQDEQHLMGP